MRKEENLKILLQLFIFNFSAINRHCLIHDDKAHLLGCWFSKIICNVFQLLKGCNSQPAIKRKKKLRKNARLLKAKILQSQYFCYTAPNTVCYVHKIQRIKIFMIILKNSHFVAFFFFHFCFHSKLRLVFNTVKTPIYCNFLLVKGRYSLPLVRLTD